MEYCGAGSVADIMRVLERTVSSSLLKSSPPSLVSEHYGTVYKCIFMVCVSLCVHTSVYLGRTYQKHFKHMTYMHMCKHTQREMHAHTHTHTHTTHTHTHTHTHVHTYTRIIQRVVVFCLCSSLCLPNYSCM